MSPKIIIISLLGLVIIITGLAFALTGGQKSKPETKTYSVQDTDRPRAEVKSSLYDFGRMKVSEIKTIGFEFKNTGSKPLRILNINSSCGCTTGQVVYKNFKSSEYGMHAQSGFVTEIAPNDSASINVIYNPSVMPVYGLVEREIYLTTNDPLNQKLTFSIKAFVE